jgi:HlyD family secretion protein
VRKVEVFGMRRLIRWLVILGILAGLVVGAISSAQSWWHEHSKPRYLSAKLSRGRVETVVNSTGTVKPLLSVSVGAFTSGPIAEVKVNFNSKVKKGDLLAMIDQKLFKAAVDRDQAALDTQKADLARIEALLRQAENNELRAKKLEAVNKDYISDSDMDQFVYTRMSYEAQRKLAKANIAQAEANLKNSVANLGYTEVRSPVDGIVIERKVDPGQTMAAAFQTPEMFIIAPKMDEFMNVFASVDEADIGQIRTAKDYGRVVKFTVDAYPGTLFEGKIDDVRMNSTTTQNVVTYPVVIKAPNPEMKLMPGMTANISFQIDVKEDVLRLPTAALIFTPLPHQVRPEDKHHLEPLTLTSPEGEKRSATEKAEQANRRRHRVVWVRDGELLRAVSLTLGLIDTHFAEVLEGDLHDGDEVITGLDTSVGR